MFDFGDVSAGITLQWHLDCQVKLTPESPAYEIELINPKQLGDTFQVLGAALTKIGRLS